MHVHAYADNAPRVTEMASLSACRGRAPRSTLGMYGEGITIAPCPCTPPLPVETFGEKNQRRWLSWYNIRKEIAGLLENEE